MATASVPNSFTDGVTTSATTMNDNFTALESFENASTVHTDGSKSLTGNLDMGGFKLTGVAGAGAAADAVTKADVDNAAGGAVFARTTLPYNPTINTAWQWETEVGDSDGWWDVAVNDTDFVCPADGLYRFHYKIALGYRPSGSQLPAWWLKRSGGTFYEITDQAKRYIQATYYTFESTLVGHFDEGDTMQIRMNLTTPVYTAQLTITKMAGF